MVFLSIVKEKRKINNENRNKNLEKRGEREKERYTLV